MLKVVNLHTKLILAAFEAWAPDCFERAEAFIAKKGLRFLEQNITPEGDLIVWVE